MNPADGDDAEYAEYLEGFAAGLRWLETEDGAAYLDPDTLADDCADPPYDRSRDRPGSVMAGPYNQALIDAVKEVAWHRQRPGQHCFQGEDCPVREWMTAHPPSPHIG